MDDKTETSNRDSSHTLLTTGSLSLLPLARKTGPLRVLGARMPPPLLFLLPLCSFVTAVGLGAYQGGRKKGVPSIL